MLLELNEFNILKKNRDDLIIEKENLFSKQEKNILQIKEN
jgi:hypothetical protein